MKQIEAIDLIAIIVIVGSFILIFFNRDGTISSTLALIVGYYFGRQAHYRKIDKEEK